MRPPIADLYFKVRTRGYLFAAWRKVHGNARHSDSDTTKEAVQAFGRQLLRQLDLIRRQLYEERYEFRPARGVPIERDGKAPRPIVVHDVRDRVVQRSLLDVIMDEDPIRKLVDHPHSFGGLPGKGVADAVEAAYLAMRSGSTYFLRSDIKDFFSHIPRERALGELTTCLSDGSLNEFLGEATRTELSNREELGHLLEFFPDSVTGVPQGHSLSALLGNVLLRPFDDRVNSGACICLRYLDDFLILGSNREEVWAAFRAGREILSSLGLEAYDPHSSEKAVEGSTKARFTFLGCDLSDGFVHPSRENQKRLVARVRERLDMSKRAMVSGAFATPAHRSRSLAETLRSVGQMVEAWSKHYRFCNAGSLFAEIDRQIDELLDDYMGMYLARSGPIAEGPADRRRRMLGVWRLSDTQLEPLDVVAHG